MDVPSLTFGRYLRAVRLEKRIDLETVSRSTRIGRDKLLWVEQENHDRLPAEVFVKGFIRSYARAIDADADKAIRLYEENLQQRNRTARSEAELLASNSTFWRRFACSLTGFVVIVAVTLVAVLEPTVPPTPAPEPVAAEATPEKVAPVAEEGGPAGPAAVTAPAATPAGEQTGGEDADGEPKKRLHITATEKTWLKVNIDKKESREYILNPGDTLEFEADAEFNLLIGNAAGVRLVVNGRDLPVPGRHGQVVNLEIP